MKAIFITFLIIFSANICAGGSTFELKVIKLDKINNEEYYFKFIPLSTPYGQELTKFTNGNKIMTVIIKYECNKSLYSCLTRKRTFTKKQHSEALLLLQQQAVAGKILQFGVMAAGFYPEPNKKGIFRSNGLFHHGNIIYSYENPFL